MYYNIILCNLYNTQTHYLLLHCLKVNSAKDCMGLCVIVL